MTGGELRDRADVELEILEALVDRRESGMTVFELRSHVDIDIETIEEALAELRDDDLITVDHQDGRTVIQPADRVVEAFTEPTDDPGYGWLRDRIQQWWHRYGQP